MRPLLRFLIGQLLMFVSSGIIAQTSMESQTIRFAYDADGNRTGACILFEREIVDHDILSIDEYDVMSNAKPYGKDFFDAMEVSLYPNPTNGNFYVRLNNRVSEERIIAKLCTMTGNVLETRDITKDIVQFDLGGQSAGIYILSLTNEKETHIWKVIKQ